MNLEYLLTGAEMASCDARTSNVIGIPSLVLMERAALSVADSVDVFLRKKFSGAGRGRRPVVLAAAGRGNNGADALAAGRILLDRGWDVRFCRLSGKISPDSSFGVQENILRQYGKEVAEYPDSLLSKVLKHQDLTSKALTNTAFSMGEPAAAVPDLIIDGLFGTGLSRDLSGQAAECVEAINFCRDRFGSYVVAVDIPSGISSDDGSVMGCAVRCDETATFAFYKRGHFLHPGTVYAGVCHLAQIGITWRAFEKMPSMFTLMDAEAADLLPVRDPGGNKGTFGKVLIAAGRRNMCGAALLAARACMAAGAGMVRIFTHEANRLIIQQAIPEALLDTFTDEETPARIAAKLRASLDWADIAAAGPAMGTDETAAQPFFARFWNMCRQMDPAGLCADLYWMRMRCAFLQKMMPFAVFWRDGSRKSPVSSRLIWLNLPHLRGGAFPSVLQTAPIWSRNRRTASGQRSPARMPAPWLRSLHCRQKRKAYPGKEVNAEWILSAGSTSIRPATAEWPRQGAEMY